MADLKQGDVTFLRLSVDKPESADLSYTPAEDDNGAKLVSIPLFKTDLTTEDYLEVTIDYDQPIEVSAMPEGNPRFYMKSIRCNSSQLEFAEYPLPRTQVSQRRQEIIYLYKVNRNARIVEVGICYNVANDFRGSITLMDLYGLVLKPRPVMKFTCSLFGLELYHRHSGETKEQRLRWTWQGSTDVWPDSLPWSDTTGPFSVFTIMADGVKLGQAHCLEFPLRPSDWPRRQTKVVNFSVHGYLFGGGVVSGFLSARQHEGEISL